MTKIYNNMDITYYRDVHDKNKNKRHSHSYKVVHDKTYNNMDSHSYKIVQDKNVL